MTQQQHHINPPDELVRHWSRFQGDTNPEALWFRIANEAAQWGADQELEACCEWLDREGWSGESRQLRAARRLRPPSLKEQALELVRKTPVNSAGLYSYEQIEIIRRALESSPDPS